MCDGVRTMTGLACSLQTEWSGQWTFPQATERQADSKQGKKGKEGKEVADAFDGTHTCANGDSLRQQLQNTER